MHNILVYLIFITALIHSHTAAPIAHRGKNDILLVKAKLFAGIGTFYDVGSGSCGETDTNTEFVVAMNSIQMKNGVNPNMNPLCAHMVYITGSTGTATAKIVDTCPSCASGSLDMSPSLFQKVCGTLSIGVCKIKWDYL
ncbi:hypothetical protein BDB01DRAFT_751034 [Pilobolus umbonatus]|nr:hypothetical protein BDB01DRAFT_751034 [Pilobolus umbonatus]